MSMGTRQITGIAISSSVRTPATTRSCMRERLLNTPAAIPTLMLVAQHVNGPSRGMSSQPIESDRSAYRVFVGSVSAVVEWLFGTRPELTRLEALRRIEQLEEPRRQAAQLRKRSA